MNTTPAEAQAALHASQVAIDLADRAEARQASRIVLAWAGAYLLGPLAMHVWPQWGLIPQQLLLVAAIAFTIYDVRTRSLVTGFTGERLGALWGLTFAFGCVWFVINHPLGHQFLDIGRPDFDGLRFSRQMWAFGVSLAMFVYVVMGLWVGRAYIITGVAVTALTLVGLLCLDGWYWLWCAATGGGGMLLFGLWLRRRSRA